MFQNYRIPRENLLSRVCDVTPEGKFVSAIKDSRKRMGASLGALSGGRVSICGISYIYHCKAISIAVRYAMSRRQFGPDDKSPELPVIEYQSQQYRLIPHLANAYATAIFFDSLAKSYGKMVLSTVMGENVADIGMEIHALSSAAKPVCSWAARDAIQECREACGGHGYLKVSQLGDIRNDNDANCTYEGENNVLIQQTSNWLLGVRSRGYKEFANVSPLKSASFFADFDQIISTKFTCKTPEDALRPNNLLKALNWLCCYLLERTAKHVEQLKQRRKTPFEIRNESQVFYAGPLSVVYAQVC